MGEYQYHEWQTIDRLLTDQEQAAVARLSSHIEVGSSRAVVSYHWSSFRHNPHEVLLLYFDAYFYLSEWGSLRLMFRFPTGLLDKEQVYRYCHAESVTFDTFGEYDILDIDYTNEEGDWTGEDDATLSDFVSLRNDLLEGDHRLLYLAWLGAQTVYGTPYYEEGEYDSEYDEIEPPIPPGLKKLSPALQNFVQVFGINSALLRAAADSSPDLADTRTVDYRSLVSRLSRAECDDFLARLAEGEPGLGYAVRRRLTEFQPKETPQAAQPRTLQQLTQRAEQLAQAERERQAQEARRRHIAQMKALAQQEPQVWQEVEDLLENGRRIASVYDQATALLEQLQALAEYQDTRGAFLARVQQLAGRFGNRPALMQRWHGHSWL